MQPQPFTSVYARVGGYINNAAVNEKKKKIKTVDDD